MAIKLVLASEEILNKKFKIAPKGYEAFDVDEFLDRVLRDYRTVESNYLMAAREIEDLNKRISELEEINRNNELLIGKYRKRLENIKESDDVNEGNIDLIRKIRAYEKFLWNNGYNPNTIK